jgi:hypothetical protein
LLAHLAKHVERIIMQPGKRAYVVSGSWNLLGHGECAEGGNRAPRLSVEFLIPIAA